MKKYLLSGLTLSVFSSMMIPSSASAITLIDNFNDGVLNNWTVQNGSLTESAGTLKGSNLSLLTYNGLQSNKLAVDAIANPGVDYVALVLNYSNLGDNLFVKIQDNNSNGLFDRVFFYDGNNGSNGLVGTDFFDLSSEVASTLFTVTDNGDGTVTASVGATGDVFGGTLTNSYTGTGVGLGFFGNAEANNFYAEVEKVPEPLTILGTTTALGFGALFRKKRAMKSE